MSKLDTKNLQLRVRCLADADGLLALFQQLHMGNGQPAFNRDSIIKSIFLSDTHWRKNGFGYWSVYFNGALIGNVGLKRNTDRAVFLEVEIHPDHQRKGFAQEAASAVVDFGFRLHKIPEINGTVKSLNTAGIKLMKNLGFGASHTPDSDSTYTLKNPSKR